MTGAGAATITGAGGGLWPFMIITAAPAAAIATPRTARRAGFIGARIRSDGTCRPVYFNSESSTYG
jgi:hypothetical protein